MDRSWRGIADDFETSWAVGPDDGSAVLCERTPMKNIVVVGTQWGDEGKGKVVDLLAPAFDIVARYQGGHNAGHTVIIGDRKFILRLVPSGILHDSAVCVLGNGVVVDAQALVEEIEGLGTLGVEVDGRLRISNRAHLILPHHRAVERISEERRGEDRVGTTMRGIGPSYEEKSGRRGVRAGDILNPAELRRAVLAARDEAAATLGTTEPELAIEGYESYLESAQRLAPFISDTACFLNDAVDAGQRVLLEGAQGTMLDLDHGSYPFVTSSSSTAGGACTGTGLPPTRVTGALGIIKAYTTRVGAGPFPTELTDERGRHLQDRGQEFGSVTGRPRRTGWFDVPVARYSARVNGLSSLALTKLDVLDELDSISVCVGNRTAAGSCSTIPSSIHDYGDVEPILESFDGWKQSTRGISRLEDLPAAARAYVEALSSYVGVEIGLISTGPERDETIVVAGGRVADWAGRGA